MIKVTSSDIAIPSLELFSFVILYIFFVVFVLTCRHVDYALWSTKITKIRSIIIINTIIIIISLLTNLKYQNGPFLKITALGLKFDFFTNVR